MDFCDYVFSGVGDGRYESGLIGMWQAAIHVGEEHQQGRAAIHILTFEQVKAEQLLGFDRIRIKKRSP